MAGRSYGWQIQNQNYRRPLRLFPFLSQLLSQPKEIDMTDQLRHCNSVRGSDFRQRLFFAVVAVILLLGILPGKASGQTLSLSQTSGAAGITVTATAAGFAADIPAGLKPNTGFYVCADGCPFGPGFLGACPAPVGVDGWANCSIQLTIPTDVGQYTMSARNSAGEYASQVFTALSPTLNISPTCGSSGTTIAATGSNWSVGLDAGIYVDGSLLQNILNYPSSSGTFSQSFTLPCSGATTLTAQGAGASVTGAAVDGAGNTAQTQVTVNIDQTNPIVTFMGGGTYTVEQTVNISCAASDALSGIASSTCGPNVTGPAYSYALGTVYNYSATATDKAGNVGKGSTSFTVNVGTALNLANLVRKFELKATIAATMVSTLQSAYTAFASGNVKSGDNQLSAFISQVIAQQGKSLTVTQANLLIQYAKALME